ncbi:MAG: hypothetical protein WC661_01345 [Opitutaceae bacterium]|jgi:hypothetical protein
MNENLKREFLYQSITDIRTTIRAIDAKVGYILVILFIPFTKLGVISSTLSTLFSSNRCMILSLSFILAPFFVISWLLAITSALKTILGIENPKKYIDGNRPESTFFPSSLFEINALSALFPYFLKSTVQFDNHYNSLPNDETEICKQLTSEQMKTMFICRLKLARANLTYHSTIIWVVSGGAIWLLHFYSAHA